MRDHIQKTGFCSELCRPAVDRMAGKGWVTHQGFTLMELTVVMLLIAILAAIAIPIYTKFIDKAKGIRAVAELRGLEKEIMMYKFDEGRLPVSLSDLLLVDLRDPWEHPYQYYASSSGLPGEPRQDEFLVQLNADYDLYSMGKDGKSGIDLFTQESWDDIIRASGGEYIGPASEY